MKPEEEREGRVTVCVKDVIESLTILLEGVLLLDCDHTSQH